MSLIRDFRGLVQRRIARDPGFRDALLREGNDTVSIPARRSCATTSRRRPGLKKVAEATGTPPESLIRMAARQPADAQPLRHHRLSATASRR
jgi:hypothetical protein